MSPILHINRDRFHELNLPLGDLLLFVLCAQPCAPDFYTHVAALDATSVHVPADLLHAIPTGGLTPADLHTRLDGTPYAALADFADWLWGETGSAFLDLDDEVEMSDADWTSEIVQDLAEQWQHAKAILDRIGQLTAWLEDDPPDHFARLLNAALGRDPYVTYLVERRHYLCEISEAGLVSIEHDDVTVPVGPSSGGGH